MSNSPPTQEVDQRKIIPVVLVNSSKQFQDDPGSGYAGTYMTLGTLIAGEDLTNDVLRVEQHFSYSNITSAATTTVKSGAGFLHSITFNKPVASDTWTMYDATSGSGTKIGTITFPGTLLSNGPITGTYDVAFSNGLTIVSTLASDGTISYR